MTRLGGFYLTGFSGGAAHSALQRTLARRLAPATAAAFGAAAGYWVNPVWGVRLQAGFIPTRFEVTISPRQAAELSADSLALPIDRFSHLHIWSGDVQLAFRVPVTPGGRVAPYGFVGGGLIRYVALDNEPLPPEAVATFRGQRPTEASGVFGIGALVPMQRAGLLLNFELADRLVRTPVRGAEVRLMSHVQLLVGFSWFAH